MKHLALVLILTQVFTAQASTRIAHELGDRCYQEDRIFKMCSHQKEVYDAAYARAKGDGRKLLVVYGYDECPWSRALMNLLTTSVKAETFKKHFEIQPIAANGKNPTGQELMHEILRGAVDDLKAATERVPLMVIVDPNGQPTRLITTVELERNDAEAKWYGHDLDKLTQALGVQ